MAEAVRTCRVGGHALAYRRKGEGEPLLLVHGLGTHSFLWAEVLELLAGRFDVIAVDLLGCGASEKPLDVSYALGDHAERLATFLRALGIAKLHVAGHGVGSGIALLLSAQAPQRIRSLTLVNPVGHDLWPGLPIAALRAPVVRSLLFGALRRWTLGPLVRRAMYHREKVTSALLAEFLEPLATEAGRRALVLFARSLDAAHLPSRAELGHLLDVRTTIAWGLADPFLSLSIAERLQQDIPGSRLVALREASHLVPLDAPAALARILEETAGCTQPAEAENLMVRSA